MIELPTKVRILGSFVRGMTIHLKKKSTSSRFDLFGLINITGSATHGFTFFSFV